MTRPVGSKNFTEIEKQKIVEKVCEKIRETTDPIMDICKECGANFWSVYVWCEDDQELGKILKGARMSRAWRYAHEARKIMDEAQTFYNDHKGNLRECSSPVNKARYQADLRLKLAATLAPEIFGDLRHEIRQIQKDIAELGKIMLKNSGNGTKKD